MPNTIVTYCTTIISECTSNADIFFVLDASGSVHHNNFEKMKQFVKALVSNLNVFDEESNVGLLTFRYIHVSLNTLVPKQRMK